MIRRSWHLAKIALALLAEERVGAPTREAEYMERAAEDAAMDRARRGLGGR